MPSPITTHVLDTSRGCPATGVPVELFRMDQGDNQDGDTSLGKGETDSDGRIASGLIDASDFSPGLYRIEFNTQRYFESTGTDAFYPQVSIQFIVSPGNDHYHVPLLLSPFGYSTYRGS